MLALHRFVSWLKTHSDALQAAAAIVALIGAAIALVAFIPRLFRPDLVLVVDTETIPIPEDFKRWVQKVALESQVAALREESTQNLTKPPSKTWLKTLSEDSTTQRLVNWYSEFAAVRLELRNQSSRPVSDARIHLEGIGQFWSARLTGPFTTERERAILASQTKQSQIGSVTITDLPSIPVQGNIVITVYCSDSTFARADISAGVASTEVVKLAQFEDSGLIRLYSHPWLLGPVFLALGPLTALLGFLLDRIRRRLIAKATPGIIYDAACREARDGNPDSAMRLLESAFNAGYSNHEHTRRDPDLEALHTRDDFKLLLKK